MINNMSKSVRVHVTYVDHIDMVDTFPSPPLLSRAAAMVQKHLDYDSVLSTGPQYVEYFHCDGHIEQKAVYDDRNLIALSTVIYAATICH